MLNIPVRFFVEYMSAEGVELREVDEAGFLEARGAIHYERHTVWANGVSQICLTKGEY